MTYALPEPHDAYYQISIDNEYSDIDLPILDLDSDITKAYNTLFIAIQRLGFFPSVSGSNEEALELPTTSAKQKASGSCA